MTGEIIDEKKLAQQLLEQVREQCVGLIGPGGLLSGLTKTVLETAREAELTEHLGHEHGETPMGSNMRNGTRSKTVLTEIGPVQLEDIDCFSREPLQAVPDHLSGIGTFASRPLKIDAARWSAWFTHAA